MLNNAATEVYALRTTCGGFSAGTEVLVLYNVKTSDIGEYFNVKTRHKVQRIQTRTATEVLSDGSENNKRKIKQKHIKENIGKPDHVIIENVGAEDLVLLRPRSYN